MANAETALKARMGRLKKQADTLGIPYTDDTTEDILREAVKQAKEALAELDDTPQETAAAPALDVAELGKTIAQEMAKGLRTVVKDAQEDRLVDDRDVDPNDQGDDRIYFTPMFFWILPAKRIGGQLVKAPYGKIVFSMDHGSAVRNGDQWQTRYLSVYKTNSKREQAYIETHELFGKVFFSNSKDAALTTDQVRFAQKFSLHMQTLNTRMSPELYRMAGQYGIAVNSKMSLPTLRTNIANILAQRDIMEEDRLRGSLATAAGRTGLMSANTQ